MLLRASVDLTRAYVPSRASLRSWLRSDPALARLRGSRRVAAMLAIVAVARTAAITASDRPVEISGIAGRCLCAKWSMSLTPMKTSTTANPVDR